MEIGTWLDYAAASKFPYVSGANVTVYPESHELFIAGKSVRCSRALLRLLTLLLLNFCRTVPYEQLMLTKSRRLNARRHNIMRVQVSDLRRLLRSHRAQLEIRNIYGAGYQARPTR
jgi:DNA-binding response OmpR family regulator